MITKWKPTDEYDYVDDLEVNDGIYSGYMKAGKRCGAGTLVDKNYKWRMEGIWYDDKGFVGKGRKEFSDGEVQIGTFVNSHFKEVSVD